MAVDFKGRWFAKEIILQCIRWYLAYALSYRDLEEMMAERGLRVDHSTIQRWVMRYSPALEAQFRRGKRPVGGSWRMDETYIRVKGTWKYLYRAVDKCGKTVDFLLSAKRDANAASRFFRKAMESSGAPHKITLDKSGANKAAADKIATEAAKERPLEIRQTKYLNNLIEQDHRALKRRTRSMLGFKSFLSAQKTIAGIELVHMIVIDLESYLVRRMVCDLDTKNYNRFFLSMLQKLSASSESISRATIQQMLLAPDGSAGEWPDDKKFAKACLEKPHYEPLKPMRCSMLLEALDRAMITPKQEALVTYRKLTVEHILPQHWAPPPWPEPLADGAG